MNISTFEPVSSWVIKYNLRSTHFPWPAFKFKLEVKLARLASKSPDTSLPLGVVPFPAICPFADPPWGWRISPKKLAPTPTKNRKKGKSEFWNFDLSTYMCRCIECLACSFLAKKAIINSKNNILLYCNFNKSKIINSFIWCMKLIWYFFGLISCWIFMHFRTMPRLPAKIYII